MDTVTLVKEQIDEGQRVLYHLAKQGMPISSACRAKSADDERWSLHVITSEVDRNGAAAAYRFAYQVLRSLGMAWISESDLKLVGEGHPLAKDILRILQNEPVSGSWHLSPLGGIPVDGVYVYPTMPRSPNGHVSRRTLRSDVDQIERSEDHELTAPEKSAVAQLLSQGVNVEDAERWVRKRREKRQPRLPIRAGTKVRARPAALWGDGSDDDSNPLLMVETDDGARGLVFQEVTQPAD